MTMTNSLFDDLEYMVIMPFEFVFRKIGKIVSFLLLACTVYFFYAFATGTMKDGFTYENKMYLVYGILTPFVAGSINTMKVWLSGRRLELSRNLDLNFQYQFIETDYVAELKPQRATPDYTSKFGINDDGSSKSENKKENKDFNVKEGFEDSSKLLENLIGLKSVKEEVTKLKLKLELQKKQEMQGRTNKSTYNMHMFFTGNPGTGKTTVARIITGILYDLGYIKENKCVEVGKQDIVGQYLGQSAQKANAAIQSALGGVLFIDEAYSLCENYQGDGFAKEAVEVILKSMEDHRDNLIIIFAGYTKEMKKFKEMNPGLKSRIGLTIEFPDYNSDELTQIFEKKAKDNGYKLPSDSKKKIHLLCDIASKEKDFGNGRFVENLFREVETNHAVTTKDIDAYDEKIMTILPEDIDMDILDKIL